MFQSIRDSISDFITRANDAIVYDADNIVNLRQHVVGLLANLYALRALIDSRPVDDVTPLPVRKRFALVLPPQGPEMRERVLFFIDGIVTESKIQAIKRVRQSDNVGLKDAKDFVDGLNDRPYVLPANFGYVEIFQ